MGWLIGLALCTAVIAASLFWYTYLRLPVRLRDGQLFYPALRTSMQLPNAEHWRVSEQNDGVDSGYVGVWKNLDQYGTLYINIVSVSAGNGLTLDTLQRRSFGKLEVMGFSGQARSDNPEVFFFVKNGGEEIAAFHFRELDPEHLLSTYVTGKRTRFESYRLDWLAMLVSIKRY